MTDVLSPEQRSFNMSRIRSQNTRPERLVTTLLSKRGISFSTQSAHLPGRPDFVLSRYRKAIFVHGCYWHVHRCRYGRVVPKTNAEFWRKKRAGNVDRDRRVRRALRAQGWQVLTIWECWLRGDAAKGAAALGKFFQPREQVTRTK